MDERDDVSRAYGRVSTTGIALLAATGALTVVGVLVDLHTASPSALSLYRWGFLAVAVVAGLASLLFHNLLASERPLRGRADDEDEEPDVAHQVASLSQVLVAIPFAVVLLGFVLRAVLGGSLVDYLGFLVVALALWALFFPRRAEFAEWVRLHGGAE